MTLNEATLRYLQMEQKIPLFSETEYSSGSSPCSPLDDSESANIRPNTISIKNVCFIGAGYVGGPTAAVLAFENPHIKVHVVDKDSLRIERWNSKHLPVHEPGLGTIVRAARDGLKSVSATDTAFERSARSKNLFFTTEVERCIGEADVVFISVNTPTKSSGIGAGSATNMAAFESAVITAARCMKPGAILVEKSTVPCGAAQTVQDILSQYRPAETFEILSNPEFLAEGSAIADLIDPDRILIGSARTVSGLAAASALKNLYSSWIDPSKILIVNISSSELAKLVANAMLAQRISSINTISAICDKVGADIDEIATAVGLDARIGPRFLRAGIGFGGSCFKKDLLSLSYLAQSLHLPQVGDYWESVLAINDFQMDRFTRHVVTRLHGALTGKKITILGITFKENTNDTRESPAISVMKAVLKEKPSEVAIFDPGCTSSEVEEVIRATTSSNLNGAFEPIAAVKVYMNAYDACKDSSAILIMTPWSQFCYPQPDNGTTPQILHDVAKLDTKYQHAWIDRLYSEPKCLENCGLCLEATTPKYSETHQNINWSRVASNMKEPKWIFDGRNIVDRKSMLKLGFRVENIGKAQK